MDPAFWHERWQQERIGFHLDEVNPYLLEHWRIVDVPPPARIFVPLAGRSVDMRWLADQGYEVVGNEISPIAVEAFFAEHGLAPEVVSLRGEVQRWQAGQITLLCADFMQLRPEEVGPIDAVYDRASLIALTPAQRPVYVRQLYELAGVVPQLLITLEYDSEAMDGPPFSVEYEEVSAHYGADFAIERIERRDILQESPRFRARGLTRLHEAVYVLRPRPGAAESA